MTALRLQHVSVAVPRGRLDDCRRFYRETLGMDEIDNPAGLAWFRFGDGDHVHLLEGEPNGGPAHLALQVDDLPATLARVRAAGGELRRGSDLWGAERWFTHDPAGNRIELFATPPA